MNNMKFLLKNLGLVCAKSVIICIIMLCFTFLCTCNAFVKLLNGLFYVMSSHSLSDFIANLNLHYFKDNSVCLSYLKTILKYPKFFKNQ